MTETLNQKEPFLYHYYSSNSSWINSGMFSTHDTNEKNMTIHHTGSTHPQVAHTVSVIRYIRSEQWPTNTYFCREADEEVNSFSSHKSSSLSALSNCCMRSVHACSNSVAAWNWNHKMQKSASVPFHVLDTVTTRSNTPYYNADRI